MTPPSPGPRDHKNEILTATAVIVAPLVKLSYP